MITIFAAPIIREHTINNPAKAANELSVLLVTFEPIAESGRIGVNSIHILPSIANSQESGLVINPITPSNAVAANCPKPSVNASVIADFIISDGDKLGMFAAFATAPVAAFTGADNAAPAEFLVLSTRS